MSCLIFWSGVGGLFVHRQKVIGYTHFKICPELTTFYIMPKCANLKLKVVSLQFLQLWVLLDAEC